MLKPGMILCDRYEILEVVGAGGMSIVYKARCHRLNRNVAIKVLKPEFSNDKNFVTKFKIEAQAAAGLTHPNIVNVYDVVDDDGIYFIVMELVDGITLKEYIEKNGRLNMTEAIDFSIQIASGLEAAHENHIIHRDIKPQNIIVSKNGNIKVTDFGIAMALNSTQLTQTNSVMGSVHYLPPEQASGKGSTTKSDIYSMGIIFYELLTGKLPFKGDNAVEIALKHMRDPLPNLREDNPNIPQSIENIILKATAKNPKNRYDDARSMHEDLLTALDDDRMNEEPLVYKYPEHETESTKRLKKLEELEEETAEDDEALAQKVEVEDAQDKKNKKIIIILASVLGGLVLLFLIIFFIVPALTKPKTVTIPNLKGLTVSKAEKRLEDLGLKVNSKIKEVSSDKVEEGRIVKTDPTNGKEVKKGSSVTLYKSSGEKTFKLKDYTGKNYIEIQTILETKYGLSVTIEKKDVKDGNVDEDKIIGQSLAKGSEVKKGDSITLYIPNIVNVMPDMVSEGYSYDEAVAFCKKYGLTLKTNYVETSAYEAGKVISQSLRKDSEIVEGATLTIDVAATPTKKEEDKKDDSSSNNNGNNSSNSNNNSSSSGTGDKSNSSNTQSQ